MNLESERQYWQKFYENHNFKDKVDIPEIHLEDKEIKEIEHLIEQGFIDKCAIIPEHLTYQELEPEMTKGYKETYQGDNFQEDGSFAILDKLEPIKQPTVVWKKWKEISLTEEWSEYQDTPTQKDRIVPPPGGKVEVIYENGAYFELKDTSSGDKYEAIDVQIRGRFKLKGIRGTKASIWIGRIV